MTVHDVRQVSQEWFKLRLGRLTSSVAADMLATRKDKKEAADRRNLRLRLVLERITGRPHEAYVSQAALQGQEREAAARVMYEAVTGRLVSQVGFCSHDSLMAGCSPDGVIGEFEGILEAKSPLPATHLFYLRTNHAPDEYVWQAVTQMWVTGAQWVDLFSYCPEFPDALQYKLFRIEREEAAMKSFELIVRQFLAEVDRETEEVLALAEAVA